MDYLDNFQTIKQSDFISFKFTKHDADELIYDDEVWSDGENIEIAKYSEDQQINFVYDRVSNKRAFLLALRKAGFIFFEPTP